jgi:hypothetical protein
VKAAWINRRAMVVMAVVVQSSVQLSGGQALELQSTAPDAQQRLQPQENTAVLDAEAYREIIDPHTGDRWLLLKNRMHPAGPGRLVRVKGYGKQTGAMFSAAAKSRPASPPLIRAGDPLTVEEHSAIADVFLEAVALAPAIAGAEFDVRLKIGGKVVRAVALGAGRAAFAPRQEAQP